MKHPRIFWIANIMVPLICGIVLYIFVRKDILFDMAEHYSDLFFWLRSHTYRAFYPKSFVGSFVKNQLGDLLWAYAFEITLVLSTGNLKKALRYGASLTIAAECFQLFPFVYATFDIMDIVAQLVGVILAYIVSRGFYKRWLEIDKQ